STLRQFSGGHLDPDQGRTARAALEWERPHAACPSRFTAGDRAAGHSRCTGDGRSRGPAPAVRVGGGAALVRPGGRQSRGGWTAFALRGGRTAAGPVATDPGSTLLQALPGGARRSVVARLVLRVPGRVGRARSAAAQLLDRRGDVQRGGGGR